MTGRVLQTFVAVTLAVGVGLVWGWASRWLYIFGLWSVLAGLGVGAGLGFIGAMTGGPWGRFPRWVAAFSLLAGLLAFQWMDDNQFQAGFRAFYAQTKIAQSAAPPSLVGDRDIVALFAPEADVELAAQVDTDTGRAGYAGRWLFRAQHGLRLIGRHEASRGIGLGVPIAGVGLLIEWLLAWLLARLVLTRIERRALAHGVPPA